MNYVIWDVETDSADTNYATIIEIGALLLDENFKEKERFSARCRLPQDRVPSATALCVNRSSIDLLTKQNLSHYQMLNQIEADCSGVVKAILIENGQPVEFGQPLFIIDED